MENRIATQDRKWSRDEVIELLKAQKFRCYVASGANQKVLLTELIELK